MSRFVSLFPLLLALVVSGCAEKTLKVLIVDGQNNHTVWPQSTHVMKRYLEETGRFEVDMQRTAFTWRGTTLLSKFPVGTGKNKDLEEPMTDPDFHPNFSDYDVVVSNFGWKAADWPEQTRKDFEAYVANGGGLVVVHAANNSFGEWEAYNKMIGLGGWGGRNESSGPYVFIDKEGQEVRDASAGKGGGHGPRHSYTLTVREKEHPITKGMPDAWLHTEDELYHKLRGPAENMTILATAYSSPEYKGTDRHEPALMILNYEKGRVFHTILGHDMTSVSCVGFISSFCRGTEWAASGKVTQAIPADFPTSEKISSREAVEVALAE